MNYLLQQNSSSTASRRKVAMLASDIQNSQHGIQKSRAGLSLAMIGTAVLLLSGCATTQSLTPQ
ncbi:MAG: hypothetical protein ACTICE_04690, partial [Psychrobacter celer]